MAALTAERKRQRITRTALAQQTGYSTEALRNWENGRSVPNLDRAGDIAKALGYHLTLTKEGPK
jgi:transcriptional regulator with XRE-family HTH domain